MNTSKEPLGNRRPLTLSSYSDDDDVYVRNTCSRPDARGVATQKAGQLIMSIKLNDDTIEPVIVPNTWIPINLCSVASAKDIKQSAQIRRAISSGLIELVPTESALDILSQPRATAELRRIEAELRNDMSARMRPEDEVRDDDDEGTAVDSKLQMAYDVLNNVNAGKMKEQDALSILPGIIGTLEVGQVQTLLRLRALNGGISDLLHNRLEELQGGDSPS